MNIDPILKQFVLEGKIILFFGSGASLGAKNSDGQTMPTTSKLRDLIANKFLDQSWTSSPLSEVAEIAISQADIVTVQSFLRDNFIDFEPENFQKKIPQFRWSGIYTTNYDLLIEKAYKSFNEPNKQELVPIYRTTDRIESKIKDGNQQIAYTKLHGCITKVAEEDLPLILTPEQYVSHKKGREKLFDRLEDQALSHPILFVGHSLNDSDVREVLLKVGNLTSSRPRCWALMYDFKDQHRTLWESKRISLIKGSFEDFINSLDEQTSEIEKNYERRSSSHPIESKFVSNDYSLTMETLRVMDNPLIFINQTMSLDE